MEIGSETIQTLAMDHHGLVAAVCKDLGIAKRINDRINNKDPRRVVSPGVAVVAMILNGLGFTNRRLYLTPQFFETKPVDRLLGVDIKASDLTDHALGNALDDIAEYGASQLFGEVAFEVALSNNLLGNINHIDTTSFSVQGRYDVNDDAEIIEVTQGYSKDHRPDLKQVMLSLVVNGPASMPIWMEPLSGNSSDKKSFHETIKNVNEFKSQIKIEDHCKWVGDSALYTREHLLKNNDYLWLTRVPEIVGEAKKLVERADKEITWTERGDGYKTSIFTSNYGNISQRWLLVYSQQAYDREKKTLEKKITKQEEELKKILWHLGNEIFQCETDATNAIKKIQKKYPLHEIRFEITPLLKYEKRGRPTVGVDEPKECGYKIVFVQSRNQETIEVLLNRKGRFILATNDLDSTSYPDDSMLEEYKDQQNVERGFRFLKDPWFMVDSIFLKSPKRIEALMMVMTLCLMIYNIAQYKLRENLETNNQTLPNQLKKEIKNPTMRWVFQLMEGISIVRFYQNQPDVCSREVITNLSDLRQKIIRLLGETACQIYGLIQNNTEEIL